MNAPSVHAPVLVAGAGPAGLAAALAFAQAGFAVSLIGPKPGPDHRTTALMMPSLAFLERLGVRDEVVADGAPLRVMRIIDATRRLVRSPTVSFHASEIGEEAFGWNVRNAHLTKILAAHVEATGAVDWHQTTVAAWETGAEMVTARLPDGASVSARLAIAADGRESPAREAAGLRALRSGLPQSALVLNFGHERDHGYVSTEFHTETGPMTQVPLPGGRRSSLVWVLAPETAEEFSHLADEDLALRVEQRMQSMLGRVTVEPGRQIYPLSNSLPLAFGRNRIALVGEAAHVFPPIGAQGLNLGLRDVQDAVKVALRHPDDPGAPAALGEYDRRRRPDVLARSTAVGLLNRSLLSGMLPAQIARSAGMGILGSFGPLRAFFMREGMSPGSGFRAALASGREKIGRQRTGADQPEQR